MEPQRFDDMAQALGRRATRRGGIAAMVAGMLGGFGATAASAGSMRRREKLACRNANSSCTSDDQCCSGSCVPKPEEGTGFRCAKRHAKKSKDEKDAPVGTIVPLGGRCVRGVDECEAGICQKYTSDKLLTPLPGDYCLFSNGAPCPDSAFNGINYCRGLYCAHPNGDPDSEGECGVAVSVPACLDRYNSCDGNTVYISLWNGALGICAEFTSGPGWFFGATGVGPCTTDADCAPDKLCMTQSLAAGPCGAWTDGQARCVIASYLCDTVQDCPARTNMTATSCAQMGASGTKYCIYTSN